MLPRQRHCGIARSSRELSFGLDEDIYNSSVEMVRSNSKEAKAQALNKNLQKIKNVDLKEC
jgi:hypothetical protein